MILVSSCLLGLYAKYDGTMTNRMQLVTKYSYLGQYVPVCPEQQGGLATPRLPAEVRGGTGAEVLLGLKKVVNIQGEDVSAEFLVGAQQALELCRLLPITAAILKERSPSCGKYHIFNGEFKGILVPGQGVTAALLSENQVPIYSEEELTEELMARLLQVSRKVGPGDGGKNH